MIDPTERTVLVLGANSMIAFYLIPQLRAAGYHVHVTSRSDVDIEGVVVHKLSDQNAIPECATIISLLPISLLVIPVFHDLLCRDSVRRIIAFSSTSVLTKQYSDDANEQNLVTALREGEAALWRVGEKTDNAPATTLFRPTMIYDGVRDHNVTRIAEWLRRFHGFPLIAQGKGLRQPVHAEDLAHAVLQVLNAPASYGEVAPVLRTVIFESLGGISVVKPRWFAAVG